MRALPTCIRLRVKLFLVLFALAGADSIVNDDRIDARQRMKVNGQGEWLLRYALRLNALKQKPRP